MNRREFASTAFVGGIGVIAAPALAQDMDRRGGMMPMGPAERRHGMDTLAVGSVALQTSQLAQSRARDPMVREFAGFEVEEQSTIARIINEMSGGMPPPPMTPGDRRMMDRLSAARGAMFDRDYVMGQIDGHQRLLAVQDRYLGEGRDPHQRHLAMLARGRISEHLQDLAKLRRMR
jgi:putative membrane protein